MYHVLNSKSFVICLFLCVFLSPQNLQRLILSSKAYTRLPMKVIQQNTLASVLQISGSLQDSEKQWYQLFWSNFLQFLLIHNKLAQIQRLKTRYLSSHSFSGLRTQSQLQWVVCFRLYHKAAVQMSVMGRISLGKCLFPRSHGFWKDSVSGRLLDRGPQLLGSCQQDSTLNSSQCESLHMAVCINKANNRESLLTR